MSSETRVLYCLACRLTPRRARIGCGLRESGTDIGIRRVSDVLQSGPQ